jgi:hypothetical protein
LTAPARPRDVASTAPPSRSSVQFDGSVTGSDAEEVAFSPTFSTTEDLRVVDPPPGPYFMTVFAAQDFLND